MRYWTILALCTATMFAYPQSKNAIEWTSTLQLTWNDFKAAPKTESTYGAKTFAGINFKVDPLEDGSYTFSLQVLFEPSKSWAKKDKQSPVLLLHEQYHFHLYEVYARKLLKQLQKSGVLKGEKYADEIKSQFKEIMKEMNAEQDLYDKETNHSVNEEQQKAWEKRIDTKLKESTAYSKKSFVFTP